MDAFVASGMPAPLIFEAVLRPHRSLSGRGVLTVVAGMFCASLFVTSLMYLLGAWPVIGFNGADISLAIFLMWLNRRAARATETITLSEDELRIVARDVHGRRLDLAMKPYWLNVSLEERAGTVPKLILSARGRRHEIARQLGEVPKRDLAAALTRALMRLRNPVFHNPQLDDPS